MKLCITCNVAKDNQRFGHMGRQNPKVITIESKRLLSRSESGKTHLARVNYCLDGVSQSFDNNRKVTAVWFLTPCAIVRDATYLMTYLDHFL